MIGTTGASTVITAGFLPLLDAAPLIAAASLGFAEAEGLRIRLLRETSWASLRDRMAVRHLDVAHMLAPMPIADALGLTPLPTGVIAPMALGFGGNTITVSLALWEELARHGAQADFEPNRTVRSFAALIAARRAKGGRRIRLGIVHPYSAHHYGLAYWLAAAGVQAGRDIDLAVLPPPLSSAALASEQVDGFCAGEPWGSIAVLGGHGRTITTNAHIWRCGPEKVLGVRRAWAEEDPDRLHRLLRAVYRAAAWCDDAANRSELADLLANEGLLAHSRDVLLQGLNRRLLAPDGGLVAVDGFLTFAERAATFPWISHALWMLTQMVRWGQASYSEENASRARASYRPDIYRAALAPLGIAIPSANSKVEGALGREMPAASASGRLMLGPDGFFDGRVFDPESLQAYIETAAPRR